jgi:hypothetical protein
MRPVALLLALLLAAPPVAPIPVVARGMALVNDGDFEAAVFALDAAIREMDGRPGTEQDRALAHLYLGVAYLELDQEVTAKAKFSEAIRLQPGLRLDPERFSPQVIRTFDAVRVEASALAPTGKGPVGPAVTAPVPAPTASEPPRRKRKAVPVILVVGAGAAAAGVALASGGGATPVADVTSTTVVADTTTTTTTSTTTTAPPAPTTTTTTSTTTTAPPAPTTTTTTTTLPPNPPRASCSYDVSPASQQFPVSGGNGTCRVTAPKGCPWTAEATSDWIILTGGTAGSASGTISFQIEASAEESERDGRIDLLDTAANVDAHCAITQAGTGTRASTAAEGTSWTSTLDAAGGSGQVVVDGILGAFQQRVGQRLQRLRSGPHRMEGVLVNGDGRSGTWRFELGGLFEPGSLQVIAGDAAIVTANTVVFRLAGRPGERVAFTFRSR